MRKKKILFAVILLIALPIGIFLFIKRKNSGTTSGLAGQIPLGSTSSQPSGFSKKLDEVKAAIEKASIQAQEDTLKDFAVSAISFNLWGVYESFKKLWNTGGYNDERAEFKKYVESIKPQIIQAAKNGDPEARTIAYQFWPDEAFQLGIKFAGVLHEELSDEIKKATYLDAQLRAIALGTVISSTGTVTVNPNYTGPEKTTVNVGVFTGVKNRK